MLIAVLASLAIAWFSAGELSGRAGATSAFSGLAVANGAHVSYEIQGFLIVDYLADLGATTAQASVDSLDSSGYAAEPYPGSTVLAGPGTVLGATPLPASPPGYPLITQSNSANPSSSVQQGPLNLQAQSSSTSSSASAQVAAQSSNGNTIGSSLSTAQVVYDPQSGNVDSTAVSDSQPSSFGGVLVIGRVKATAEAKGPGSGAPPTLASTFEADGISVAGQAVSVIPGGLALPGSQVPLPSSDPINQALAAANLKVQYVGPVESGNEVRSAGLLVSQSEAIPNSPNPGVLTVTFGEALASAQGGADIASTVPGLSGLGGAGTFMPSGSTGVPSASVAPTGSTASTDGATSGVANSAAPPAIASPAAVRTPATPPASPGVTRAAAAEDHQQFGSAFYLILVLASILAFGAIQFVRFFAVRLSWTSSS